MGFGVSLTKIDKRSLVEQTNEKGEYIVSWRAIRAIKWGRG